MKNRKESITKGPEKRAVYCGFKRLTIIMTLAITLIVGAGGCSLAKDGKDGLNGKDGKNGVATSITLVDGKVMLDEQSTDFDGETLSASINLSANDPLGGKVSGGGRYPLNTAVMISAKPEDGYLFVRWENEQGKTVSESQSFITRASVTEQNYLAVFEIDKSKAFINVSVRADKSLPNGATVVGGGRFAYGTEYTLLVTASDESILNKGTVLFYEVTKDQFDDENFAVSAEDEACSRGKTAVFDVDGLTDKFYVAGYIDQIEVDVSIDFNITIEASCNIELQSSDEFYGTVAVTKINGKTAEKDSFGGLQAVWAGDMVTVKATPTSAYMFDDYENEIQKRMTIDRSGFVCWIDEITGETVSTEKEYTFVAKKRVSLKAVFMPKTVIHFQATGVITDIVAKDGIVSQSTYFSYNGAIAGFYPGEEIFIHAHFVSLFNNAKAERLTKFVWQISYDNATWENLSYSRQTYLKIPNNTPTIYLKATFEKKA